MNTFEREIATVLPLVAVKWNLKSNVCVLTQHFLAWSHLQFLCVTWRPSMRLLLTSDQNYNHGFPYLTFFLRTIRVWLKRDSGQYWPSIYHTVSCKSDSSAQMGEVLVFRCLTLCLLLLQRHAPACRTTTTADASSSARTTAPSWWVRQTPGMISNIALFSLCSFRRG